MKKQMLRVLFVFIGVFLYIVISIAGDYCSALSNKKPIFASVEGIAGDGGSVYYQGAGYEVQDFRPQIGGGVVKFSWGWSGFDPFTTALFAISQFITMGASYFLSRLLRGARSRFKIIWYLLTAVLLLVYFFAPLAAAAETFIKFGVRFLLCSALFSLLYLLYGKATKADGEKPSLA